MGHSPGTSRYSTRQSSFEPEPHPVWGALPPIISLAYKMLSSLQSSLGHLEPCVDVRYVISYCVSLYPTQLSLDLLANSFSNTLPVLSHWNLPTCEPRSSHSPGTLVSPSVGCGVVTRPASSSKQSFPLPQIPLSFLAFGATLLGDGELKR